MHSQMFQDPSLDTSTPQHASLPACSSPIISASPLPLVSYIEQYAACNDNPHSGSRNSALDCDARRPKVRCREHATTLIEQGDEIQADERYTIQALDT